MYIKQSNTQDKGITSVYVDDFGPIYQMVDIFNEEGEKTGEEQQYIGEGVVGRHEEEQETTGNMVIINTEGYVGDLLNHPSVVQHPELFEVINDELPEKYTILNYQQEQQESDMAGQELQVTIGGKQYKAILL